MKGCVSNRENCCWYLNTHTDSNGYRTIATCDVLGEPISQEESCPYYITMDDYFKLSLKERQNRMNDILTSLAIKNGLEKEKEDEY